MTTKGPFSGGWRGYFFEEGRVVDREGHPVIDDLPGDYVEAMSGEYALVGNEDKQELTMHGARKWGSIGAPAGRATRGRPAS